MLFSVDVRHRQALLARQIRIGGEILLQRAFDIAGTGVLPFDAVAVVTVHAAQQATDLGLGGVTRAHAQGSGSADEIAGALQQWIQSRLRWHQRRKVIRMVIIRDNLRIHLRDFKLHLFTLENANLSQIYARLNAKLFRVLHSAQIHLYYAGATSPAGTACCAGAANAFQRARACTTPASFTWP
ncbi:hypothetical protein D3C71_1378440 [compost metagenome]